MTDTHLGHDKMAELCYRPKNFAEKILQNTSSVILPGDIVIHLGDVCIRRDSYWHQLLHQHIPEGCKRWLVRGNHDNKSIPWYIQHGWDFAGDRIDLEMYGLRIALSHRPLTDDGSFDYNIHGHHHITGHHPEDEVGTKHRLAVCETDYCPKLLRHFVGK